MQLSELQSYDFIIVAFSGGKDSIACLLHLLETGVDRSKIELWHHDVDGGDHFMDWPCTPAYCRVLAAHFGIPIYFSWREGGFRREMLRNGTPTARTLFEQPNGTLGNAGGHGQPGTRLKFPQVSADLKVRWCSPYLKIDVASIAIKNQPRFYGKKTLFITGERAQESPCRAAYKTFEPHRTNSRSHNENAGDGKINRRGVHRSTLSRKVDHFRPVHGWSAAQVWQIIERYEVNPHPAYWLGWGRVSCLSCIFGSPNQWASVRKISPDQFLTIRGYESQFGVTIKKGKTVEDLAAAGTPYADTNDPQLVAQAMDFNWNGPATRQPWILPPGASGELTGPI